MHRFGTMAAFYDEIKTADGTFKYYVNGEWRASTSGKTVSVLNPSKGNTEAFKVQACTQVSNRGLSSFSEFTN